MFGFISNLTVLNCYLTLLADGLSIAGQRKASFRRGELGHRSSFQHFDREEKAPEAFLLSHANGGEEGSSFLWKR